MNEEKQSRCICVPSDRDSFQIHQQACVNTYVWDIMPSARDMLENEMDIALILKKLIV